MLQPLSQKRYGEHNRRIEVTEYDVRKTYGNMGSWKALGENKIIVKVIKEAVKVIVD